MYIKCINKLKCHAYMWRVLGHLGSPDLTVHWCWGEWKGHWGILLLIIAFFLSTNRCRFNHRTLLLRGLYYPWPVTFQGHKNLSFLQLSSPSPLSFRNQNLEVLGKIMSDILFVKKAAQFDCSHSCLIIAACRLKLFFLFCLIWIGRISILYSFKKRHSTFVFHCVWL